MAGEKGSGKKSPRKDAGAGGRERKTTASGKPDRSSPTASGKSGSRSRSGRKRGRPTLTPLVFRGVLVICAVTTLLVLLLFVFGSPVRFFAPGPEHAPDKPVVIGQSGMQGPVPQGQRKPQPGDAGHGERVGLPPLPQVPQPLARGDAMADAGADTPRPAPVPAERRAEATGGVNATGGANGTHVAEGEVRQPVTPGNLPYEESLDAPVEAGVKQVDYALLQTVTRLGLGRDRLHLISIENRQARGQAFHFQRMELGLDGAPDRFVRTLKEMLAVWSDTASLEARADDLLIVTVEGLPTHEISLRLYEGGPPPVAVAPDGARLAIVIDDIGESMSAVQGLVALDYPVTLSVWPRSSHAREAAELAHKTGHEVLIHMPMEPVRYPQVKPGPGAVLSGQQPGEIAALVRDAVRRVPHAAGLNNHMGSRATQNATAMRAVCGALDGSGMFVLDSMTHPASKLHLEARRTGLPVCKRNVFLDVIADKRSILFQLDKAARIAQAEGQAVAIGHPLPETLAALKEWERTRDRSVAIVHVRQLSR